MKAIFAPLKTGGITDGAEITMVSTSPATSAATATLASM
jgi:hypothetical protein